ncbi:MAG: hypothetical protein WC825_07520, partial [Gallionellaceae bacterium]
GQHGLHEGIVAQMQVPVVGAGEFDFHCCIPKYYLCPFALSLSKGWLICRLWFDKLTTNGFS